ncbi:MAG TPA: dihydrodipicolinate synthase family protein [Candidatus Acetothermia bacterium]|nr:dihydrodipicolinate synthase family protein [Candidatus Acetothermia bacterium]
MKDWRRGVWVAMVTPWDPGASRPRGYALEALVERFVAAGVHGLYVLGTTGEGTLLSLEEREGFLEDVLSTARGRLPVIVHTGHDSTDAVVRLSLHAREAGAVAVAVAPPTRYRLDQQELFQHYAAVAEALGDFPLLLYDIPGTTCNPLGAWLLSRLRGSFANVVGAKVSRSDWEAWCGYLSLREDVTLFVGVDEMVLPLIAAGAQGLISSLANIFPELYVALYRTIEAGELVRARELQRLVWELADICHRGSPLAYVKSSLSLLGVEVGPPLPPLRDLGAEERETLRERLHEFRIRLEDLMVKGGGS